MVEPGHLYIFLSPLALVLLGLFLLLLFLLIFGLGAAIGEGNKSDTHEQRLLQMQVEKQRAESALTQIKQDYLQRISNHAQRSQKGRRETA